MSSDVKVLQPNGVLNTNCANQLRQEISDLVAAQQVNILIDCQGIEFMDSMGLSCLIMALKQVRAAGGSLALSNINTQIRLLLELTAMEDSFKVRDDSLVVIKTTNWKDEPVFYLGNV
jgi:anti-anti-sigma factor